MKNTQHYLDEYPQVADSLPGQALDWLNLLRASAFDHFSDTGFPSLREEEWRYTNVSAIEKKLFSPLHEKSQKTNNEQVWVDKSILPDAYTVVILNGHFSQELSTLDGLPEHVTVCNMAEALEKKPHLVERYFAKAVSVKEHGFVAFNTAWFTDGLFVHIPEKQVMDKPIQLLHLVTQAGCLVTNRHIVAVEEMTKAEVVETYVGVDDAYLTASVTEVFVGRNADLTVYKVQGEGEKAYHFGGLYVQQARDSRFNHHNFAFGGLLARSDIHTELGLASECDLNGLYLGGKRQHIDNHTRINHAEPHAVSRELYKGVLSQRARGVFQGRVIVAEDAQKTDSEMNNRNLLLSNDAEIDTKPQLEIYADDVKCAHGVTVGQLDEKSIFYLKSRGIDEGSAKNILTFAFVNEMVNKVKIDSLREVLLDQLLGRFPQEGVHRAWM